MLASNIVLARAITTFAAVFVVMGASGITTRPVLRLPTCPQCYARRPRGGSAPSDQGERRREAQGLLRLVLVGSLVLVLLVLVLVLGRDRPPTVGNGWLARQFCGVLLPRLPQVCASSVLT